MKITFERRTALSRPVLFAAPVIALGLAMLTSLILFAALGKPAGQALYSLLLEPFVGWYNISEVLLKMGPLMLIAQGLRVAVLAVDPSSARSGGSILGDKTRMEHLSREPNAFIRPSPSQTHLGGVARRTREAVSLCEAAGFDVVLIETVGVGQSETMVAEMADLFILLLAPAGGDELQGVKRGIMEMADLILVNKADGDLKAAATRTMADYAGALRLLRKRPQDPPDFPKALAVSALADEGLGKAWEEMTTLAAWRRETGHFARRRSEQARHWFGEDVRQGLLMRLTTPDARESMATLGDAVAKGTLDGGHGVVAYHYGKNTALAMWG